MLTQQEIFNKTVEHLRQQKTRSVFLNEKGKVVCAYKGNEGMKCPIGYFIPEEKYRKEFEGKNVNDEIICRIVLQAMGYNAGELGLTATMNYIAFLRDLQIAHDFSYTAKELNEQLTNIAKRYNLTPHDPIADWE